MMFAKTTRAVADPDVLHTALESGDSVLLHLGTTTYYSLNESGARIWKHLGDGLTVDEVTTALEAEYEVSREQAMESVTDLATELVAEKLVRLAD